MKIVFLTTAHNSLSQRAFVELVDRGHTVIVVLASCEAVMLTAVEREHPDLIVAPMLKACIPASIWQGYTCIIVHPGIKGDRGASSLDWAILNASEEWGVTLLQAGAEMDAGPIWATRTFPMRAGSKSSLYRHEVTEAAIHGLLETIAKFESHIFRPEPLDYRKEDVKGRWQPLMKQADRAIDWSEPSAAVLRKICCADSFPGVFDTVLGMPCYLYGAHAEEVLRGTPGEIVAKRDGAICRATGDGAVWITHLKQKGNGEQVYCKLPATQVLGERLVMAAMQGNVAAGGVMLALAADLVYARKGIVLNPHYKAMGNLYGSEYWTYLLPKRVGATRARELTEALLPISGGTAQQIGLIDEAFEEYAASFRHHIRELAEGPACSPRYEYLLEEKRRTRESDEASKPLQAYREEELHEMWRNFFGADRSYHLARQRFVYKGLIPATTLAEVFPI